MCLHVDCMQFVVSMASILTFRLESGKCKAHSFIDSRRAHRDGPELHGDM